MEGIPSIELGACSGYDIVPGFSLFLYRKLTVSPYLLSPCSKAVGLMRVILLGFPPVTSPVETPVCTTLTNLLGLMCTIEGARMLLHAME